MIFIISVNAINSEFRTGFWWWIVLADIEKAYWNHEVAQRLNIGESTLRKYCMELEKNGYTFIKGSMDSRAFTDRDLIALTHFQTLYKKKKLTREEAAKRVVERYANDEGGNDVATPVQNMDNRSMEVLEQIIMRVMKENQEKQKMLNDELLEKIEKRLEEQNKLLKEQKEHMEKHDKMLMENLRRAQEEKAAAIESQKKKSKWQQLKEIFIK